MMILSVLSFIVILGVLVLVHELGHFLVARWNKVGVEEFGFGFPPRLFGKKFGNTLYSINAIPLGGFVKIKGVIEEEDVTKSVTGATHTGDDFMAKALWQRFSILIAGIVMNVLLTMVLFSIGYMIGLPAYMDHLPPQATIFDQSVIVEQIAPEVPAAAAGLQSGDQILAINGTAVRTVTDIKTLLTTVAADQEVTLSVQHESGTTELTTRTIPLADGSAGIGAYFAETGRVKLPFGLAIVQGVKQTGYLSVALVQALGGIVVSAFQGQDVSSAVAGPVGIATDTYRVTQMGFVYVLQFAALLSLNLAIFNFLPFPPLDGGKLIFVVIEAVIRRPVPMRWQILVHNVGFVIFLLFIMAVTVKDVLGLVS